MYVQSFRSKKKDSFCLTQCLWIKPRYCYEISWYISAAMTTESFCWIIQFHALHTPRLHSFVKRSNILSRITVPPLISFAPDSQYLVPGCRSLYHQSSISEEQSQCLVLRICRTCHVHVLQKTHFSWLYILYLLHIHYTKIIFAFYWPSLFCASPEITTKP